MSTTLTAIETSASWLANEWGQVMARSSPRDKNMLVRRLNGNLPKNAAEWEKVRAV